MHYESNIDLESVGRIACMTSDYRKRKEQAFGYIQDAFECSQAPYLALSGGKDSVAMLALVDHVAKTLGLDFECWLHFSDASFPGTEETCTSACEITGRKLVIDRSEISAWDVVGKQSSQKFGKTGFFFDSISRMAKTHDMAFVGVRAKESKRRMKACESLGHIFDSRGTKVCHPIKWLTIEDVAGVLHEYKMPIHPIYKLAAVGDMPIRLGYATSLDLIDKGTAVFMRKNYPDLFRRLSECYPQLRSLA